MTQEGKESWTVSKQFIEMIFGVVVVGLLSWNVYTTQTMTVQQAVVGERVLALQVSLANTVTKNDLDSQMSVIDGRISRLEQITTSLNSRTYNIESRLNSGKSDVRDEIPVQ